MALLSFVAALLVCPPARGDTSHCIDMAWVLVGPNKGWWKEVQVPLGTKVWLGEVGGPGIWLTLSNDTNVAVTVRIDSNQPESVLKRKGLASVDARSILTTLYKYGDKPVYYVDDGKAKIGYAKLRIEAP